MSHPHAIVWLDHRNARIIAFSPETSDKTEIQSAVAGRLHTKSGIPGSGRLPDDVAFFDQVAKALEGLPAVLITGPGTARKAFESYVAEHHRDLSHRIVGSETLDHPTDGELLDHARRAFHRIDQLGLS